jgi:hypothetical protein
MRIFRIVAILFSSFLLCSKLSASSEAKKVSFIGKNFVKITINDDLVEYVPEGTPVDPESLFRSQYLLQVRKDADMRRIFATKTIWAIAAWQAELNKDPAIVHSFGTGAIETLLDGTRIIVNEYIVNATDFYELGSTAYEYNLQVYSKGVLYTFNVRKFDTPFTVDSPRFTQNRKMWKEELIRIISSGEID